MMFEDKIRELNGQSKRKTTYSIEEVMEMLQVAKSTVFKLINNDCFGIIKVGKHFRVVKKDFDEWLDGGGY